MATVSPVLDVGSVLLGRYEVLGVLGQGGSATTFLVQDRRWGTQVALKLLRRHSPALAEILRQEFSRLRELYHPHLCQVHDLEELESDSSGTLLFYTADYVDGATFGKCVADAEWQAIRRPLGDALEALSFLHAVGLVHGDFKPDNILVSADLSGTLIDLGCASPTGASNYGVVCGTPAYLAPELLRGSPPDVRTDLYSVGIALSALHGAKLPSAVGELTRRLTAPDPEDRPSCVQEVLEALWPERGRTFELPPGLGRLVGRGTELDVARSALSGLEAGEPGPRVLHWVGVEGIGKSRLLGEIRWTLRGRTRALWAHPIAPRAICDLLERATGASAVHTGVEVAVDARSELLRLGSPCLLFVDDANRLSEPEQAVLCTFARCLEPTDPVLMVVTSTHELELDGRAVRRMTLGHLTLPDVEQLLGETYTAITPHRLQTLTAGHPAAIRSALLRLATAASAEPWLDDAAPPSESQAAVWQKMLGRLDSDGQRMVGILAAMGTPIKKSVLEALSVPDEAVDSVLSTPMVVREPAGYRLANPLAAPWVLTGLSPSRRKAVHRAVADGLLHPRAAEAPAPGSEDLARAAFHLLECGDLSGARELVFRHADAHADAPRAWLRTARALTLAGSDDALELTTARLEQMAGRASVALARLQALVERTFDVTRLARLRIELGACALRLGNASAAASELRGALRDDSSSEPVTELDVQAADLLAQALCRLGAYDEALRVTDQVLAACTEPRLRADLDEVAGVALGYLGRYAEARKRLAAASEVEARSLPPRQKVRSLGARALVEFQTGHFVEATELYAGSLTVAEAYGLTDQLANAVLNLGTVHHQRGSWAEALGCYERASRLSSALNQTTTLAHTQFNLAKIYVDLGDVPRANATLSRCTELAQSAGISSLQAAAEALRAEIACETGDYGAARRLLDQTRTRAVEQGDARDVLEAEIQLLDVLIALGDLGPAGPAAEDLSAKLAQSEATDLVVRGKLVQARWFRLLRQPRRALSLGEEALGIARRLSTVDLEADAELLLGETWHDIGSDFLAAQHRSAARTHWERAAALLPAELRASFWKHRRRCTAVGVEPAAASKAPSSGRERKLKVLVDAVRRLNSSLKTRDVLERAMDAAIELTEAERGFLLLFREGPGGGPLTVAVARNLDREELGSSHLKFSRSIAEQAIANGQAVVTASAQQDPRFSAQESVHAMRLKSVICVPVTSPAGPLGALYLDHRFETHRFSEQDIDLVVAFADQVAIALGNAKLHAELEQRNRELVRKTRQVEQLLRDKEAEVDRLTEQVALRAGASPHRFDYGAIIGSSPAMQQVLDLLDRVIDTDLTILIEGESGTGKELIARAIHANCPSRSGPMVAVNCAAMPEPLLEAELFGYCRGAFTGADRSRDGLFVQARGGTLLLDELGEMPASMQVKLLRALQEREVRPLGASRSVTIDIRLVCATNRHLRDEIHRGTFREDLYYRISGVEVRLPPLRERSEDFPELVDYLVRRATQRMQRSPPEVTRPALRKLSNYPWPGNVRQLENVLIRALVLGDGRRLTAADVQLPDAIAASPRPLDRTAYAEHESRMIAEALHTHGWNVAKVARVLRVSRPTLYRRMRAYGLERTAERTDG